jgi:NAD(P)-dependent dehydrogenase (short-subunit alcohol dehydrogenase family)
MSRHVLVSGATGGIGRALVERLANDGSQVVATGRDASILSELEALDGVHAIAADLLIASERDALPERAKQAMGGLDAIVHTAGIVRYAAVGDLDEELVRLQMEVNWLAPLMLSQAALPHLDRKADPNFVFVASTLGVRPAPATGAYSATKAALLSSVRSLAQELAPTIRVNAVVPGVIDTPMVRNPQGREFDLEFLESIHPVGRLGTPAEVAAAIVYLLDAAFVTGTELAIDGGLLIA